MMTGGTPIQKPPTMKQTKPENRGDLQHDFVDNDPSSGTPKTSLTDLTLEENAAKCGMGLSWAVEWNPLEQSDWQRRIRM